MHAYACEDAIYIYVHAEIAHTIIVAVSERFSYCPQCMFPAESHPQTTSPPNVQKKSDFILGCNPSRPSHDVRRLSGPNRPQSWAPHGP